MQNLSTINMARPIYLDYNSTSPVHPDVLKEMLPTFTETYGNPSSENHSHGEASRSLVTIARQRVAKLVNMSPSDVIFTSGATEANNLALQSMISSLNFRLLLVGATEHKSILEVADALNNHNKSLNVVQIPVNEDGILDDGKLALLLDQEEGNALVSVMAANSETGVLNPMESIAKLVHHYGSWLHCDATQAVGRVEFDADALGIDMVSISSHKIYGPKGAGALIATRHMRKMMSPILYGGGQEDNLRSGTLNVPSIVGFGKACEIAFEEVLSDSTIRQKSLRDHLESQLLSKIPDSSGVLRTTSNSFISIHHTGNIVGGANRFQCKSQAVSDCSMYGSRPVFSSNMKSPNLVGIRDSDFFFVSVLYSMILDARPQNLMDLAMFLPTPISTGALSSRKDFPSLTKS